MHSDTIRRAGLAGTVLLAALIAFGIWLDSRTAPPNPAELAAWERAREQDDELAYRRFIEQWAVSRYIDEARERLSTREQQQLAQEAVDLERRRAAILEVQRGLGRIGRPVEPTGELDPRTERALRQWLQVDEAESLVVDAALIEALERAWREREVEVWRDAESAASAVAYREYLELYPDGVHVEAARRALAALDAFEARRDLIAAVQSQIVRLGQAVEVNGQLDSPTVALLREFAELRRGPDDFVLSNELLAELESLRRWPLRPGERFVDCAVCPDLVVVPGGRFLMGSPSGEYGHQSTETPQREVQVQRFAVSATEVTFAQWAACVAAGGCSFTPSDSGWGGGDQPVINVSLEDAQAYARWLGVETGERYRLPSEAEWEYAARAGADTPFPSGRCIDASQANFDGSRPFGACPASTNLGRTAPVGQYPANRFGLHDMHGNVREWVSDCWNGSYRGAPIDGSAWMSGDCGRAVVRGGSWNDTAIALRSASRVRPAGAFHNSQTGFRVVRELRPGE